MALPRLSNLEMQILEVLWAQGASSIREIQEKLRGRKLPAYTTVQTMVYRLEAKQALKREKKGAAHIFTATVPRDAARRRLIDEFLTVFGGETQPVMAHLIEAGKLTLDDVQEAEKHLRSLPKKDKKP